MKIVRTFSVERLYRGLTFLKTVSDIPHTVQLLTDTDGFPVPTAAHSTVSIHSTCFQPMHMVCCAYSCTHYVGDLFLSLIRFLFDTHPLLMSPRYNFYLPLLNMADMG